MSVPVSILIPTYNRAGYLREAIRSALAQTHENIEVLILDDASPDSTPAVAAEFRFDPRLHYLRHPKNLGITGNWRAGIEAATGSFFCLLHDDDTFAPTFVETLLRPMMDDHDLLLTFCDHWVMDAEGNRLEQVSDEVSGRFKRDVLRKGRLSDFAYSAMINLSIPAGASLFRRSVVTPEFIDSRAQGSIDAWLMYQCVKTGYGAYYIPDRLMNYRTHPGGMSVSMPLQMGEGHLFRYRQMLADPELKPLRVMVQQQLSEALTGHGLALLADGKPRQSRHSLAEALRLKLSLRTFCGYLLACGGNAGNKALTYVRRCR